MRGPRPRGGLEALHRHPGREDQRAAVRSRDREIVSGPNTEGCMPNDKGRTSPGEAQCGGKARDAKDTRRKERRAMTKQLTGTRKEWLAARLKLLEAEKELTRRSDELARRRQELPWVRIDKEYRFETDEGSASLADLFRGRSQLLVYHFMFGPDYTAGCPSCSAIADGFDGFEPVRDRRAGRT